MVCPNCGAENENDATFCMSCGFDLSQPQTAGEGTSPESNICGNCGVVLPSDAVFCSKCGTKAEARADQSAGGGKTMFFGAMQEKGKAKLILVKGGGMEGVSYNLSSTDHVTGREEGFILFPDDNACSPKHANFFYFGGKLFVEDQNSLNGVYVRIKAPVEIVDGMWMPIGEQLFKANLESDLPQMDGISLPSSDDDTLLFAGSEIEKTKLKLTHVLEGGHQGMVVFPDKENFTVGRESCDLNFPDDGFISGKHSRITKSGDKYFLADNGSKNGTFYRIGTEQELMHGDYLFIGEQLLRVEVT